MSENIHIKLPDGSVKEVPAGATALDIAKSISSRLADAAIAISVGLRITPDPANTQAYADHELSQKR